MRSFQLYSIIPVNIENLDKIDKTIKPCYFLYDANDIDNTYIEILIQKLLHPNERKIVERRKNIVAKKEYIASRFLIKTYIEQYLNISYKEIQLCFDEKTNSLKALYKNKILPLHIVLSHSKGLVFFGINNNKTNMGVDIEYHNTQRDITAVMLSYFHPSEASKILSDEYSKFYSLWTLKEALAKITGESVLSTLGQETVQQLAPYSYTTGQYKSFSFAIIQTHTLTTPCFYLVNNEKALYKS